jgi:hypothetical protein
MPASYKDSLLLMDLTARRTDWGPALGGDDVVVHTTLPDIFYVFGNAEEKCAGRWLRQLLLCRREALATGSSRKRRTCA